ncbi:hypothetical protein STAFG_2080 [Streptomyces afghaniensis 772]|uniref:Uncharacterized protein n=1 Tax=Streptomyces afghaniensis 772 TaxID=1283301 RepID=S4NQY6_9ACTN|nr:hypothetical protein STAFG_2080 [Streptomyces afghaniensis 772]
MRVTGAEAVGVRPDAGDEPVQPGARDWDPGQAGSPGDPAPVARPAGCAAVRGCGGGWVRVVGGGHVDGA